MNNARAIHLAEEIAHWSAEFVALLASDCTRDEMCEFLTDWSNSNAGAL